MRFLKINLFVIIFTFSVSFPAFAADYTINYTYDSLDRLTNIGNTSGPSAIFTYDSAGNRLTAASDSTPPTTPIVVDDGQYTNVNTQLHATWSSSDPETGIAEYQYAVGTTLTDTGNYIVNWTSTGTATGVATNGYTFSDGGIYYFYVKARNGAGAWSTTGASDGIIVDATPPTSIISSLSSGSYIQGNSYTITGSASDGSGSGVAKVEISFDGGTNWAAVSGTTAWNYSWTLPADGKYTILTRATDNAGNVETPSSGITIYVDKVSPVSAIVTPSTGTILYGSSASLTGTATADSGLTIQKVEISFDNSGNWTTVSGTTNWSYAWTLPADGAYTIITRATDSLGKIETPGAGINITVDNTTPVLTKPVDMTVRPAQYSPNLPEFEWVPNACEKFNIFFSGNPCFKKSIKFLSDNMGISDTFNPSAGKWNKITRLGNEIYWKVKGWTAAKQILQSNTQRLVLDGGYSNLSNITFTNVSSIPTMECDPASSESVLAESSPDPYFLRHINGAASLIGSIDSYTPNTTAWRKITRLGSQYYWRFMGKLSTGETTYSETSTTAVTGGPVISDPANETAVSYPLTISWDPTGFVKCIVQANAAADFSGKTILLGASKTGSLTLTDLHWSKLKALGSPVYIRAVGITNEKYTVYGQAIKINLQQ